MNDIIASDKTEFKVPEGQENNRYLNFIQT